jgi:hypothetical protein
LGHVAPYIEPNSDRPAIINELIVLFDGPQQRDAQGLASEALGEAIAVFDRLKVAEAEIGPSIADPVRLRAPTLVIVCEAWVSVGSIESKGSRAEQPRDLVLTVF